MENDDEKAEALQNWRNRIIDLCEAKLGRKLETIELEYVGSLDSFLSLEYLQNEAELASVNELEDHLKEAISLFDVKPSGILH